jgi:hypothetical protein
MRVDIDELSEEQLVEPNHSNVNSNGLAERLIEGFLQLVFTFKR